MDDFEDLATIRNIGIIAHIDAGKTTTTERMLYYSGKTHRIGEIDEGTTVMDYLDEERQRGITIVSAAAAFRWEDTLIHLIDTPGHIDFTAEVERSLRVIDGAVVIFSGVEGVEAQSEKVWHQADRYRVPRLAFVNKLDRVGASFPRVLAEINRKFDDRAVAVHMPVGIEDQFRGVVDLLTMQLYTFTGDQGETVETGPVPDDLVETAKLQRAAMVERLADLSDDIAERYLEGAELDADYLRGQLRRLTIANRVVPVLLGSAKKNIGVQPLMRAVIDWLPSPDAAEPAAAETVKTGETVHVAADPEAPFSGLVFKVIASPSADLYYLRTYSGQLAAGDAVWVPRLKEAIKAKRLLRLYAKNTEPLDAVGPGDIVGLIGPRNLVTGDTLCARHRQLFFESMHFPEPVLSMAVEPRSSRDKDRLDEALALICREDPTLTVTMDENTGQRLLAGMGELHLEIKVKKVEEELRVPVRAGQPRVAFRETVRRAVDIHETFHKIVGETELEAGVEIRLEPLGRTDDAPFAVDAGMAAKGVPKALLEAAVETLGNGLRTGGNYGYPLIYIRAELCGLDLHPDRSTEGAVNGAVLKALDRAIAEAGTVILEPLMSLEILTPEDTLGELSNDLQARRAVIHRIEDVSRMKRVHCEVPLAEMFGFSKALPKLSGGRGSFSMEPCGYAELAEAPE